MATEPADPFVTPNFEDCFAPAARCWCGWSARQPSPYSKHYYCCERCGTHYAAVRIRPEAVGRFYGFQSYWRDRNRLKQHERFEERAALFARQGRLAKWLAVIDRHHRGPPGFLLEIGCAEGTLLAALRQRGWQVTGLEPDPATAAATQTQTGLAIQAGAFPCPLDLPPLDAVVALDVLEHAADPRAFLEAARHRLKPGGFLFLQTPLLGANSAGFGELNNRAFDPQEHAFLFTRDSVADLLAASGFGVVENHDAWSVAHEIVVARPRAEAPASPRPLGNLAELFSPPWAAVAEELAAFATQHGLASHVRSPRAWEYPWLWLQGLSSFDWRGRHVVDLGSEISPWPWWLATHGARVTLVEVRRDWLPLWQRLRSELGVAVDWVLADNDAIPLPDGCADVVTSVSVLEHQGDQPRAVAELARVLRPGGWLGFTCDIFEPSLGMTYPEWNGKAIGAADFEDWVWRRPEFGRADSPAWNWADVDSFLAWFNRTAPHHNYAMAAALLQKASTPLPPVVLVPPTPATLVATLGGAAGTWAAAPWLENWSRQEATRLIFWVVPATELARLRAWLPAAQVPPCDFTAAPRLAARQLARDARPGLILLTAPLAAEASWDANSPVRLLWWRVFLAEFSWTQALVPAGSSDWLSAFTAAASRAPQRSGPPLPPETVALVHPLLAAHGHFGPVFTEETAPGSTVADELATQFARLAPLLSAPPVHATTAAAGPVLLLTGGVPLAWPVARWRELEALLTAHHVPVETQSLETDSPLSLARLRQAALVVSSDPAIAQWAAAVDVPAVLVTGGAEERRWRPARGRVSCVQGLPACQGCGGDCFLARPLCIEDIPVDVVENMILRGRTATEATDIELVPPLPPGVAPEQLHVLAGRQLRRLRGEGTAAAQAAIELRARLVEAERLAAALREEGHHLAERRYVAEEASDQRLQHIYELEQRLAAHEASAAEAARRLAHIYELEQRLAASEADGAQRLVHIHELEQGLAANEADREARLQHIHHLEERLLGPRVPAPPAPSP